MQPQPRYQTPSDAGVLSPDDPRAQQRRGWMVSPAGNADGTPAARGSFADKQAQLDMLRRSPASSQVARREKGGWEAAPPKPPSRLKQALMGVLQGGLAGGASGPVSGSGWRALGGAATGGATGAINPRLMQSIQRQQKIAKLQGDTSDDLALQGEEAGVRNQQAQATYNESRARTGEQHYIERKNGIALIDQQNPEGRLLGGIGPEATDPDDQLMDYYDESGQHYRLRPSQIAQLKQSDSHFNRSLEKPTATDAQVGEGEETTRQAGRAREDIQRELDALKGDWQGGRDSLATKDALYQKRAAEIVAADVLGNTSMAEALAQAQAEDKDYASGTYNTTKSNTESKQRRIEQLEKELLDVNKEQRGGAAKAARGGDRQPKSPGPDGKVHYSLDEIREAAGPHFDATLKRLRADKRVVID